jgi:hypothetical protein
VKLHAINKEEPTKKFVGRKRKTAKEESKKHHPITARGLGDVFGAREDDRRRSDEETLPLSLGQIGFLEFRGNPLGRRSSSSSFSPCAQPSPWAFGGDALGGLRENSRAQGR